MSSPIHGFICLLCVGIFLLGEAASALIADFFKSDRLLPVVLVSNPTFLITGFQQVPSRYCSAKWTFGGYLFPKRQLLAYSPS